MKKRSRLLLIDAVIDLILGLFLVTFPAKAVEILGIPQTDNTFYPNVLGAVLLGISVALWIEYVRKPGHAAGLGLAGAVSITLLGALAVVGWLVSARLAIPARGQMVLWALAIGLITISLVEVRMMRLEK